MNALHRLSKSVVFISHPLSRKRQAYTGKGGGREEITPVTDSLPVKILDTDKSKSPRHVGLSNQRKKNVLFTL